MNRWKCILQAIDKAIDSAKAKYEHNLAETSKFKEEKIIKVAKALNKKIGKILSIPDFKKEMEADRDRFIGK